MECHPYIGMKATVAALGRPGQAGYRPEYTGTIVYIGTDSEECEGYALHYPAAILLLADGSHTTAPMCRITVDPAQAAARLAKP